MDAVDAVGDDVEVLGRPERHVDAGERAELPRPLAGAVDDDLAGDLDLFAAVDGSDAGDRGRRSLRTATTSAPSTIFTPRMRAPLASDIVRSAGLALPSPGIQIAPARSSVRSTGNARRPRRG